MKIFGIGLNKTGTSTLKACCAQLGYSHVSCRRDLLIEYRKGNLAPMFEVADKYDCFDDWPWPLAYKELWARYADEGAVFVLTHRISAEKWLSSLKKHSLMTHPVEHCRGMAYGHDYPFGHEAEHIDFYNRHTREVRAFFESQGASDRLLELCWENGDGWDELCGFLGQPVPDAPFPHTNKSATRKVPLKRRLQNRWAAGFWGKI
ncbi:sulfotransferase family protein [Octadecabacter sp. CECT 8868]|uniref:sulfotransferase family protein n=1 Tax=Octadecabacter algicola TaxID=2909342 RepID=UPI001F3CE204|nr:sulfotransferase family protein [Octadecabacter algicola]MCF2906665.1 sulfotransferase family protein [Octadecabacter algicola]